MDIKLDDEKLKCIVGGTLTSTMVNAISRLISTLVDLGKSIGSSIYRYKHGVYCR